MATTYFELKGLELQDAAETVDEARRYFRYSCRLCAERGRQVDCDHCAINYAHRNKVDLLQSLKLERLRRESEERRKRFGLESLERPKIIIVI